MKKKQRKNNKEKNRNKWIKRKLWVLPMPIVIVIAVIIFGGLGIVGALNGWFGGGDSIPVDTFTQGLVGYWSFDEGSGNMAYDASDNGNHGTLTYMSTNTQAWVDGKVGGALRFDGTDDYVNISDSDSLDITDAITIEAWIKLNAVGIQFIVDHRYNVAYGFWVGAGGDDNGIRLQFAGTTGGLLDSSGLTFTVGTWYQVVVRYDGAESSIWCNGVQNISEHSTGSIGITTEDLTIGANYLGDAVFNGTIDEVRIYNRALSAAEIRYHYNRGGPVAHWKFDEGAGSTVYDATENDNDISLQLAPSGNTATSSAWTTGRYGTAINLDGTDDYLSRAYDTDFNFGTDSFSISTWFKHEPITAATVDDQIDASNDDTQCEEWSNYNTGDYMSFPQVSVYRSFMRFPVDVPEGATIEDGCYIKVYIYYSVAEGVVQLQQTDEDDAADLSTLPWSRSVTGSTVNWTVTTGSSGDEKQSPEIKTIIQDKVDRADFDQGDHIVIRAEGISGGVNQVYQYDGDSGYAAKLHIEYTLPSDYLISRYNAAGWKSWLDGNGNACFGVDDDATWGPDDSVCSTGTDYADGKYHHLQVVKDGTSDIYLYVDGVLAGSNTNLTATGSLSGSSPLLYIGGDQGATSTWQGSIDDMRIYNYARTADEVRLDYNAGFAARFGPLSDCDRDPGSCMTQGLVGYWDFEEGNGDRVLDKSGNGNNGTMTYMSTSTNPWTGGIVPLSGGKAGGSALQFDGTDDYVNCGNDSSLDITTFGFTLEGWVNLDIGGSDPDRTMINKWGGGYATANYYLFISEYEIITFGFGEGTGGSNYRRKVGSDPVVSTGWHHIAGVVIDENNIHIYYDGVEVSGTYSGTATSIGATTASALIGRLPDGGRPTDGLIDEVRIYNRALSAAEIRYHYNRGGPVAHWKFDEGAGSTVYDATENDNDISLQLAPSGNTATSSAWTTGRYGTAINLDGTDDYLSRAYDTDFNFGTDSFTISTWFKHEPITAATVDDQIGASDDDSTQIFAACDPTDGYQNLTTNTRWASFRFTPSIPPGATIEVAYLTPSCGGDVDADVFCEDTDNASQFTSDDNDISNRSRTISTTWTQTLSYDWHDSPSLVSQVQAVVNRAGWSSDNGMVFILRGRSEPDNYFYMWDYTDHSYAANLHVEYKEPKYLLSRYNTAGWKLWNSGMVCFGIDDDSTWGGDDTICSTKTNYDDNKWHHVQVVKDGTKGIYLYVDGILVGSNTNLITTGSLSGTSPLLYIGGDLGATSTWQGAIDDMRIYNYARTADEIRLDYNAGFAARFGPLSDCDRDPGSCMKQGLVGYWDFEEGSGTTVKDKGDNSNNGTFGTYMTTSTNPWTGGVVPLSGGKAGGSALQFDGGDDYVNVGNSPSFVLGSFSLEAWIKTTTNSRRILSGYTGVDGNNFYQFDVDNSGYGRVWWRDTSANLVYISGTTLVDDGQWHHLVGVRDAKNQALIYIDGVLEGTAPDTTQDDTIAPENGYVYLGATVGLTNFFNGLIDEVKVYNRALSAAEIRYHYNRGGPVAHWQFDEGEGRNTYDSTKNDNDGTLVLAGSATSSAWVTGRYGTALSFDGTDDYVNIGDTSQNIKTVSFWFKADANNKKILDLDGGTHYLEIDSNNDIQAQEFSSPTIYIDGVEEDTVSINQWYHVVVTTDTAIDANNVDIGRQNTNYYSGLLDDVRFYSYVRTEEQVRLDYNAGLSTYFR